MADARSLGDIIRRQRELNALSMRQLAEMVGISNPYLSQIERGLRDPSAKVVEAIAQSLQLSADALYAQAGMAADGNDPGESGVLDAIRVDRALTGRQREALIAVYEAFVKTTEGSRA